MSLRKILPKDTAIKPGGVDVVKQVDVLLEALPSGVAFLAANSVFKYVMRNVLGITKFPHALVGMFVFFGAMCSMKPADADKVLSSIHAPKRVALLLRREMWVENFDLFPARPGCEAMKLIVTPHIPGYAGCFLLQDRPRAHHGLPARLLCAGSASHAAGRARHVWP